MNTRFNTKRLSDKQRKGAHRSLTDQGFKLLTALEIIEDERGQVAISNAELAKECGWSLSKLKVYLSELREKGYLVESDRVFFLESGRIRERARIRVVRPIAHVDFRELCRKVAKPVHNWLSNRQVNNIGSFTLNAIPQMLVRIMVAEQLLEPAFADFALTKLFERLRT